MIRSAAATASVSAGICDYGIGNIASLRGALERTGLRTRVSSDPAALASADLLVLPGVGAMPFAMATLRRTGLDRFIGETFEARAKPILGICLGMQLLFEHSEEGDAPGLGLLPGQVRRFGGGTCHVGWAIAQPTRPDWPEAAYYFNHSYFVSCAGDITAARIDVEGVGQAPAIVRAARFTGVQFHPEKSQVAGRTLFQRLAEEARDA